MLARVKADGAEGMTGGGAKHAMLENSGKNNLCACDSGGRVRTHTVSVTLTDAGIEEGACSCGGE